MITDTTEHGMTDVPKDNTEPENLSTLQAISM